MARQHIRAEIRTSASPAAVYALLIDGSTWPTWSPIDSFELERSAPPGPEGIGAIRIFRTGRVTSREVVVERGPDRRFSYELLSGLAIRNYRAEIDLVPDGDGTVIRWHSSFNPKVPGMGRIYRRGLTPFIEEVLAGLAAHAARTGAPT